MVSGALALSSTAVVIKQLGELKQLPYPAGPARGERALVQGISPWCPCW